MNSDHRLCEFFAATFSKYLPTGASVMENRKQSIRGKLGVTKPAGFTLVKALQDLREKNRKACDTSN